MNCALLEHYEGFDHPKLHLAIQVEYTNIDTFPRFEHSNHSHNVVREL